MKRIFTETFYFFDSGETSKSQFQSMAVCALSPSSKLSLRLQLSGHPLQKLHQRELVPEVFTEKRKVPEVFVGELEANLHDLHVFKKINDAFTWYNFFFF